MNRGRPPIAREVVERVLELRDAGRTWGEIGAELGIPRQTAWSVYHDSAARLREARMRASHNSRVEGERIVGGGA